MVSFQSEKCIKKFRSKLNLEKHSKTHKNRRSLKKNRKNKANSSLKIIGVNSAGLSSKIKSFEYLLNSVNPAIFLIQETKKKTTGKIKCENSKKYQIYELVRKMGGGGGLALGVLHELNPVWVGEGDDQTEVLSVIITIDSLNIRCVVAYGPQEDDTIIRKQKFWERLEFEVNEAQLSGMGFMLQMDGNLWAGPDKIPGDPNRQNKNGKLFAELLEKFPHLTVANSLSKCKGVITRSRQTSKRLEVAVLDFFIICDKLLPFVKSLLIDEEKCYSLTNFNPKIKNQKVKESDHNTMILELKLKYSNIIQQRVELFNFRNIECQKTFYNLTSETSKLSKCFINDELFSTQAKKWKSTINSFFHKSFKEIRVTNKKKVTELSILFD